MRKTLRANPVLQSARFICKDNPHITVGYSRLADIGLQLSKSLQTYTPHAWHDQPLHHPPIAPYDPSHQSTKATLDWLFFISTLNFSFWSDAGPSRRFAVDWNGTKWDGYWSLLAAVNRALDAGIPLTTPSFFANPDIGSDEILRQLFSPSKDVPPRENLPLLKDRIAFLRQVGAILIANFEGSYMGLIEAWSSRYGAARTCLQLVEMVVDTFPCYQDQCRYRGRMVHFWKRAQILVAETWAAFHPVDSTQPHPIFPNGIQELTMFADYRVPQLLMHLGVLVPSPELSRRLAAREAILPGSDEEIAIRGGSVLSVHLLNEEICRLRGIRASDAVSDVMIDFWLWDEAKRFEKGEERMIEAMRVRGVFY